MVAEELPVVVTPEVPVDEPDVEPDVEPDELADPLDVGFVAAVHAPTRLHKLPTPGFQPAPK